MNGTEDGFRAGPRRLCFVVNGFAVGGGELKLLELIEAFGRRDARPDRMVVAAVGQSGPLHDRFAAAADRVEVFAKRHRYDFLQVTRLARLIREEKPDLVQTTLFYADVIGTLAARLAGVRRIVSWEAVTQPYGLRQMAAFRTAAKAFSCSVSVSEAIRKQVVGLRHVDAAKTRTIRYGVDTAAFRPAPPGRARRRLGLPASALVFGTVARLTEQKGHRFLIEAAPRVLAEAPGSVFVFVGDGPLRPALEARAREKGVREQVRFTGFRDDAGAVLPAFDVFVLPSLYEGLPNVVLEAMACGLPVVATAVDGTPEAVVNGRTGLLVPPRDPEALADALLRMARDGRRRRQFGLQGRARAVSEFSLEGQVDAFRSLYDGLMKMKE